MAKGGSGGRRAGGGNLKDSDILDRSDMIANRAKYQEEVDDVLSVSRDLINEYGVESINNFEIATLKPGKASSVLGFCDQDGNIAMNKAFMNTAKTNKSYDESVKSGWHPSRGDKSGVQAVAAHESGHALNHTAAQKMGLSMDAAADRIVTEARKSSGKIRGNIQFSRKISDYATKNNKETIAEAVSDVYCNGKKARAESQAVVKVLKGYLK